MSLDDWQARLESHFEDVTLAKLDQPHEPVTFAFEHGLGRNDRAALAAAIHGGLKSYSLHRKHYLCWAAYAAEFGYKYAGDEFWHSFRSQTPGWDKRNRWFIKACFQKFQEQYNGAKPKGPWARKFSIICWPITHAILPADLQRQLAEILFRVRHTVVKDDISSPRQLGQIIASRSLGATSRFAQLASEHELIGQIASALLLDDRSGKWIEASALKRITRDLSAEEQARSWLRDARHHVSHRAQVRGLKGGRGPARPKSDAAAPTPPRPRIRPTLALQPVQERQWRLLVKAPNFTPLVRYYSDLQPILRDAMVRLGVSQRPHLGRALLHSPLSVPQSAWPTPNEPLIAITPSQGDLDALLAHETTMSAGPWLFRLNQDGVAAEVRSKRVSPNADYILVTDLDRDFPLGEKIGIGCENVMAWRFSVSSLDDAAELLEDWSLGAAKRLVARPAGLPAVSWDREGAAEWLSTQRPIVFLKANFAISRFEAQLDVGTQVLTVTTTPSDDNSVHVALPLLPAGTYFLDVSAHAAGNDSRVEHGTMEISIRDALPTDDRATALISTQDPSEATLPQLLDGAVSFQVHGPPNRSITASIRLLDRESIKPILSRSIQPLSLPVDSDVFSQRFERLMQNDKKVQSAFLEADTCEIQFKGSALGSTAHRFERPFVPLRWGLLESKEQFSMTLFEDAENPDDIETYHYGFSTPLKARELSSKDLRKAANGGAKPGLYVARTKHYLASSIVPVQTMDELRTIQPRFFRPTRDLESVRRYLETICLWHLVDSRGNVFGRWACRRVTRALVQQVVGLISGPAWYKAERFFENRGRDLSILGKRIPYKKWGQGWAELLVEMMPEIAMSSTEQRIVKLADITGYKPELCEFALRLASSPATLYQGDMSHLDQNIRAVMQRSELVRAARLTVLGTSTVAEQPDGSDDDRYVEWRWS